MASQEVVTNVGYNLFGQRVYMRYGNDTETRYDYDPARKWMKQLSVNVAEDKSWMTNSALNTNTKLLDLSYNFDVMGNVRSLTKNGYDMDAPDERGNYNQYSITQEYSYNSLYELTRGVGTIERATAGSLSTGDVQYRGYSQNFAYDDLGRMTNKISHAQYLSSADRDYSSC